MNITHHNRWLVFSIGAVMALVGTFLITHALSWGWPYRFDATVPESGRAAFFAGAMLGGLLAGAGGAMAWAAMRRG